ncbi:hypothetical protein Q7P37_011281 [Cladosporium fusiforme]
MDNATNSTFNGTFDGNGTFNGTYSSFTPPAPKPFWTGLLLPTAYLVILIGSLYSFSTVYRQRQIARASKLEPWFPQHVTRNIYLSLLHLDPEAASDGSEKKLSKVPDSVLKAALLKRAVEDIQRIVQLRQAKPALQTLLQRGSVGEELWQRFQVAEQEMEAEVKDVVSEANAFAPNWGQVIFQSANEINQNILLKKRIGEMQVELDADKVWWENKRAGIQDQFMKELEGDAEDAAAAINPPVVAAKKTNSDDDAVLVEAGGPAQVQGGGKKKGKK